MNLTAPSLPFRLNHEQGRCRIGLLALANDHVVERDMMTMRPDDDQVMIFTSRVPFEGDIDCGNLVAMAGKLSAATDLILPGDRLDAVIYACTSGTATIGHDRVTKAIHEVRPGTKVVTPVSAANEAFRELGLEKISVLAPYSDEVTAVTVGALEEEGIQAVRVCNFGIVDSGDISAVTPESILEAAISTDHPEADGVFISCTDLRAVQVIDRIESKIGKPVITSNQAAFRLAIRHVGYRNPIHGFGRLLLS